NAAIAQELHLSVKRVEPLVSAIFAKLGLHTDAGNNQRVLAALGLPARLRGARTGPARHLTYAVARSARGHVRLLPDHRP
ncbi:MAG: hypothetical protein LH477_03125, partial [Nocardioides sp.]|nr:hypothetical protein [Nocardioides sp.]